MNTSRIIQAFITKRRNEARYQGRLTAALFFF